MRKFGLCSTVVLLMAASNALALSGALSQNGTGLTTINVGPGGGTFDLSIDLSRLANENTYGSIEMKFVTPDAPANTISIVGVVGSSAESGTGTRYNDLEWDANTGAGAATSPNGFSGTMTANVSKGPMVSISQAFPGGFGTEGQLTSHFGHLVVTLAPGAAQEAPINLTITGLQGGELESGDFNSLPGAGFGVTFVPEPATALLLLGALPFIRRRRSA